MILPICFGVDIAPIASAASTGTCRTISARSAPTRLAHKARSLRLLPVRLPDLRSTFPACAELPPMPPRCGCGQPSVPRDSALRSAGFASSDQAP
jgi:hypothetical protein